MERFILWSYLAITIFWYPFERGFIEILNKMVNIHILHDTHIFHNKNSRVQHSFLNKPGLTAHTHCKGMHGVVVGGNPYWNK